MTVQEMKSNNNSLQSDISITTEKRTILAHDGTELQGTLFFPEGELRGSILVNAGTGIPQRFYTGFATYLAQRGYGVLTFDYRGIGESKPHSLRGYDATKRDWGRLDMTAAFATIQVEWPEQPHYIFGHSVGGQLLALMENGHQIDGIVTYGSGYGYWANLKGKGYRAFVGMLWYVGIPLLSTLFRYIPASRLGLGEDLPAGVALDWARWGKKPDYFTGELGHHRGFSAVQCQWKAFLAEDDDIATPDNAYPLYRMYPKADVDIEVLKPQDFGSKELGHMRFFSRSNREAWTVVADWFDQRPTRPALSEQPSIPTFHFGERRLDESIHGALG